MIIMKKNRSKIFQELDVHMSNPRWAWCAKNESLKIAVFIIWADKEENGNWLLHNNDPTLSKRHGAKDQKNVLELCLKNSFTVYGIVAEAIDPNASTRKIKGIDDRNLVRLKLNRDGQNIYGVKVGRIPISDVLKRNKSILREHALLDFNPPKGSGIPDRAKSISYNFRRDQKVRNYVLKRANGKCEYCGVLGFELNNGERFLETHHIISLANQGPDTYTNVIALCPNHHREAHFGKNAEYLENEFVQIIKDSITT